MINSEVGSCERLNPIYATLARPQAKDTLYNRAPTLRLPYRAPAPKKAEMSKREKSPKRLWEICGTALASASASAVGSASAAAVGARLVGLHVHVG